MQHVHSILSSPTQMSADAPADNNGVAVNPVRLSQRLFNPTRQPIESRSIDARTDNREFIPAEPRDGVRRPGQFTQPASDGEQHLVAGVVAVGVVDGLEPVEIDVQHADIS